MAKDDGTLRVTSVRVKPNCRKMHGSQQAMQMALDHLKRSYWQHIELDCNKNAEFEFILTMKRDNDG